MTDDVIAVEYELTPEEWVAAAADHSWKSDLTQKALRQIRMAFGIVWTLLALLTLVGGNVLGAVVWAVAGAVWTAILPSLTRWSQRRQLGKVSMKGLAHGTFGPHRVELRDEGILDFTPEYEWLIRWSAIDGVKEVDGNFLVYTGPNAFLPIPSSAFRDARTVRAFGDRFFRLMHAAHGADLPPASPDDPQAEE